MLLKGVERYYKHTSQKLCVVSGKSCVMHKLVVDFMFVRCNNENFTRNGTLCVRTYMNAKRNLVHKSVRLLLFLLT